MTLHMKEARMFHKTRLPFSFLLFVILNACAVGPDYEEPPAPLQKEFSQHRHAARVESEVRWWKSFHDPSLNALIEKAIEQNKDIARNLARINESRSLARAALSDLFPGFQLSANYEKAESTSARFPDGSFRKFRYEIYNAGLDAAWEIDLFGGLRRELEARNAEYAADVAGLDDSILMVLSELSSSYISLRAAQEGLAIGRKNRNLQKKTLEVVKTKLQYGEVSELDLAQAETQLAQTEAGLPPLRTAVKVNAHRLAVLLGQTPDSLYESLRRPNPTLPLYQGPAKIGNPEEMLRRRPDIRMAERRLAAHTALVGAAIAELFPKIRLTGSLGVEAPDYSDLGRDTSTYHFGPQASWAIFQFGQLRAEIHAAEAREQQALLAYEQAVLVAQEDVENALLRFQNEKRRSLHLAQAARTAKQAYNIAFLQYEEGMLDVLDLLVIQRALLQNESDLVVSREASMLALVGVYKAFGGGWEAWELGEKQG